MPTTVTTRSVLAACSTLQEASKMQHVGSAFLLCLCLSIEIQALNPNKFPDGFLFGTATSAYQVEGGWNVSGKGENIWDRFTREHADKIADDSNGDISCDSYHKFQEDVALMKAIGVNFYRFSLSWSRILPKGFSYKVNPDGIRYYNDLIDLLLANNIAPMVTLFHYDTPQPLQDLGGFANELFVGWFEKYAQVAFENFGEKVKLWQTFNEPRQICLQAYGSIEKAPALNSSGIGEYICAHNLLKAHAKAYNLYDKVYRRKQKGKIGIALDTPWFYPKTGSKEDKEAVERTLAFVFQWYADPIFSRSGDYPKVMKQRVDARSKKEGFDESRIPKFTRAEIRDIRGTYDYLGVNHYTSMLAEHLPEAPIGDPSFAYDLGVGLGYDPNWPPTAADWIKVVPDGFHEVLKWLKKTYGNIEIYITENGYADDGELADTKRIDYYQRYLSALLDAIHNDRVDVKGFAAWSLLDNFEWMYGYSLKFGMYHVDFNDPGRTRTPKASVEYFRSVIRNRKLV